MKLSEAMLLGAMIRPQGFGNIYPTITKTERRWFRTVKTEEVKTSCALGAAFEAANVQLVPAGPGIETVKTRQSELPATHTWATPSEWWPVLKRTGSCDVCGRTDIAAMLIPHMNDDHRLTRERIAAWVETLEKQPITVTNQGE